MADETPTSRMIERRKDIIARLRARLDQREKQFENQYDMVHPMCNLERMDDLEVWKFRIEIAEWELEQHIPFTEDES